MAAADPPPQHYIALPDVGIQNQDVRNMLGNAALADFKHDFGGLKFADALREAIAQIPEGTPNRGQKILRAKVGLGDQGGNVYNKYIIDMGNTLPEGIDLGVINPAVSEDTILDTVLGVIPPPDGVEPNNLPSFANIKNHLVNKQFLPLDGFVPLILETPIQGNTYQIRGYPVKWKVRGENQYNPLSNSLRIVSGVTKIVLMIDASFFAFSELMTRLPAEGVYDIFIICNIENDSDPATKIKKIVALADELDYVDQFDANGNRYRRRRVNVFFLKEKNPDFQTNYPLVDAGSVGRDPVFFSKYTLQTRRNKEQTIDAKLLGGNGNVFQAINNVGTVSEINEAGSVALKEYIESIPAGPGNPPPETIQKMMNYFMLKRAGDWCQALSLADTTREYHVYDHRFNPYPNPDGRDQQSTTLQQLQNQGCEIALVTHDRILLAFALYIGINVIFSTDGLVSSPKLPDGRPAHPPDITSVNWMVYFKNIATDNQGVRDALIAEKKNNILNIINGGPAGPGGIPAEIRDDNVRGILEVLKRHQRQGFIEKVREIMNRYINREEGLLLNHCLTDAPAGAPARAKTLSTDVNFRNYIRYFRLALYQLSILVHPNNFERLPLPDPAPAVLSLNDWSAIENYVNNITVAIRKNNSITPGGIAHDRPTSPLPEVIEPPPDFPVIGDGVGQIKQATPLPPNDHGENEIIGVMNIIGQTPFYDNYEVDISRAIEPQQGGAKQAQKKSQQKKIQQVKPQPYKVPYGLKGKREDLAKEALKNFARSMTQQEILKIQKVQKIQRNILGSNTILNKNKISTSGAMRYEKFKTKIIDDQIHKYYTIINKFIDLPALGGIQAFNKVENIITPIQRIIPYQLGPDSINNLRRDRKWGRNNYKTVHNDIFIIFRGQNANLQGGAGGDTEIKRLLKKETMNTIPLGNPVTEDGDNLRINNNIISKQNYLQYICNKSKIGEGNYIIDVGVTNILAGLLRKALDNRLEEPLFTAFIEYGFRNAYDQYLDTDVLTRTTSPRTIVRIIEDQRPDEYIIQRNNQGIPTNYEYKPRGSTYYDINNNQITVVDNIVIDSTYESSLRDILDRYINNQPPFTNTRKEIPFFIYRFVIYYLDKILQRIRKLPDEYVPRKRVIYTRDEIVWYDENGRKRPLQPDVQLQGGEVELHQDNANQLPGYFEPNNFGEIDIFIGNNQGIDLYITRNNTDTEETLVEKYKLEQELTPLINHIYINNPGRIVHQRNFRTIANNFLRGVNLPAPPAPDFRVILPSKQRLYNRAKRFQFMHMISYYIWMYQSVDPIDAGAQINSISDYLIQNMIGPGNRTEFLYKFLEIDEVLFQGPPAGANQAQQLALQNIQEKGLLQNFKDSLIQPLLGPAPRPLTQFENMVFLLGIYDLRTIRNHIIRPIFQSLNTIIQTVNGIGIGHIVDEINIDILAPEIPPPAGGGRRTRKQRKTHRGVKTRTLKPRKQSPRRHKKRSKNTRKH